MKYRCTICGHIYDEEKEIVKFEELPEDWVCPMCGVPKSLFEKLQDDVENKSDKQEEVKETKRENLKEKYLLEYERSEDNIEKHMKEIHIMAQTAKTINSAMGTEIAKVSFDDILILGNQLNPMPLLEDEEISLKTIIGKKAKKPMKIDLPVFVSHMSFGALSKEAKVSLSKGAAMAHTAMCSGEGGILVEEKESAYKYIFEYIPNKYSVTDKNLKTSDAIEIKIGQGTKPGMGGHLPGEKVTEEVARVRNKQVGEDIVSPARYEDINSKEDLKKLVDNLRARSEGRPIGIKIAAGRIEQDLEFVCYAKPDFITIDGRGGATASSPKFIKDSTSIPTIYALSRARKYLDDNNYDMDLIITGGLRVASDFAKALAIGADAIAIATAPLMAIGCQQYRLCNKGNCPVGIATQNDEYRKRLNIEKSAKRLANYFTATSEDLKTFARITGHNDIHNLNINDIVTINRDISEYTSIKHV